MLINSDINYEIWWLDHWYPVILSPFVVLVRSERSFTVSQSARSLSHHFQNLSLHDKRITLTPFIMSIIRALPPPRSSYFKLFCHSKSVHSWSKLVISFTHTALTVFSKLLTEELSLYDCILQNIMTSRASEFYT